MTALRSAPLRRQNCQCLASTAQHTAQRRTAQHSTAHLAPLRRLQAAKDVNVWPVGQQGVEAGHVAVLQHCGRHGVERHNLEGIRGGNPWLQLPQRSLCKLSIIE